MNPRKVSKPNLTLAYATVLIAASIATMGQAQAGSFRAYLSASGSDANPCTLAAPCRLLPAALDAVNAGGEVWILDSANYNVDKVTVTKSVTILAVPGVVGSIVANNNFDALQVTAPNGVVALRNLVFTAVAGSSGSGVRVTDARHVSIEGCVVAKLKLSGVLVYAGQVDLVDTVVRDNGERGIGYVGGARGSVVRSKLSGNGSFGMYVTSSDSDSRVSVLDSDIVDNQSTGIYVYSEAGTTARVSVLASRIARNTNGVEVGGPGTPFAAVQGTTFTDNPGAAMTTNSGSAVGQSLHNVVSGGGTGLQRTNGTLDTDGRNVMRVNGVEQVGTLNAANLY